MNSLLIFLRLRYHCHNRKILGFITNLYGCIGGHFGRHILYTQYLIVNIQHPMLQYIVKYLFPKYSVFLLFMYQYQLFYQLLMYIITFNCHLLNQVDRIYSMYHKIYIFYYMVLFLIFMVVAMGVVDKDQFII